MEFVHDLLAIEEFTESVVPSVHSVDLELVVFLSRAVSDVADGPLGESGGDLLGSDAWILGVVSQIVVGGTSSSVFVIVVISVIGVVIALLFLGASMRHLVLVVKSASLVSTFKVSRHSTGVGGELGNPVILRRKSSKPIVHQFLGEHCQLVQSLKRVAGRNLLLGNGDSSQKSCGKFHLSKCIKTLIEVL